MMFHRYRIDDVSFETYEAADEFRQDLEGGPYDIVCQVLCAVHGWQDCYPMPDLYEAECSVCAITHEAAFAAKADAERRERIKLAAWNKSMRSL